MIRMHRIAVGLSHALSLILPLRTVLTFSLAITTPQPTGVTEKEPANQRWVLGGPKLGERGELRLGSTNRWDVGEFATEKVRTLF